MNIPGLKISYSAVYNARNQDTKT